MYHKEGGYSHSENNQGFHEVPLSESEKSESEKELLGDYSQLEHLEYDGNGENQEIDPEKVEKFASEVAKGSVEQLAEQEGLSEVQKQILGNPDFQAVAELQTKNSTVFGSRFKQIANVAGNVGVGMATAMVARKAFNFLLPGAGVAAGGLAGAAYKGIMGYRAEKKRAQEATSYLEDNKDNENVTLAAKYLELANDLEKNPGQLGKQFELIDLAERIKTAEMKEVRGADLIIEHIKARSSAEAEIVGQDKANRKILQLLERQYGTTVNKATVAKSAAAGAALGALGATLGGLAMSLFSATEVAAAPIASVAKEVKSAIPDTIQIKGNIWNTAKEFLQAQGIEANNSNVLKAAKQIAIENDVKVADWKETTGSIKDTAMPADTELKGWKNVLKEFGQEVGAEPSEAPNIQPGETSPINPVESPTTTPSPEETGVETPAPAEVGVASNAETSPENSDTDYYTVAAGLGVAGVLGAVGYRYREPLSYQAGRAFGYAREGFREGFDRAYNFSKDKAGQAYEAGKAKAAAGAAGAYSWAKEKVNNPFNSSRNRAEEDEEETRKQAEAEQAKRKAEQEQAEKDARAQADKEARERAEAEQAKRKAGQNRTSSNANKNEAGDKKEPGFTKLPEFKWSTLRPEFNPMFDRLAHKILNHDPKKGQWRDIKASYKIASKKNHPDLFPAGSPERAVAEHNIRQVNSAYDYLDKKYNYDYDRAKREFVKKTSSRTSKSK